MSVRTQAASTPVSDQAARLLTAVERVQADVQLPALFQAVCQAACHLAQSDSATLYMRDGEHFRCVAVHQRRGTAEAQRGVIAVSPHWPPLRQLQADLRAVLIEDTGLHASWSDLIPSGPEAEHIRTWVGLPLTIDGRLLGFLGIGHEELTAYTEDQKALLERFAPFAARTLRSALLHAESSARSQRAAWRADIGVRLRDATGAEGILEGAVNGLGHALGASICNAYLRRGSSVLDPSAVYRRDGATLSPSLEHVLHSLFAQALLHQRTVAALNLPDDPSAEEAVRANRESLLAHGVRALVIAPLLHGSEAQGLLLLLQMEGAEHHWDANDLILAEQVAADAAHALARDVLYRDVEMQSVRFRSERDWLRLILDELPAAVVVSDLSPQHLLLWNRAAAALAINGAGFVPGVQGEPLRFEAYTPEGAPYPDEAWPLVRAFHDRAETGVEPLLLRRRDGERTPVLASAVPIHNAQGQINGALMLLQPVSGAEHEQHLQSATSLQPFLRLMVTARDYKDTVQMMADELQAVLPFDALILIPADATEDGLGGVTAIGPRSDQLPDGLQDLLRHTLASPVLEAGAPVVHADLESAEGNAAVGALLQAGFRSCLLAPVTSAGQVIGSIGLFSRRPSAYGARHVALATQVSTLVGLALRHEQEAQAAAEGATREERDRLARVLHENLAQTVTGVVMQLDAIRQAMPPDAALQDRMEQAASMARAALSETRRVVWDLRMADPDLQTPSAILEEEVSKLARRTGLQPEVVVTGEVRQVPAEVCAVVQRLLRVALENIWTHSAAQQVRVHLDHGLQRLTLLIEDDGQGFDPETVGLWSGGRVGLAGAAERIRRVGGSLRVESAVGHGTRVYAEIPYTPGAPAARVAEAAREPAAPEQPPEPSTEAPVRVVLIDDHTMVREGLVHMLQDQPDLQVVGATSTGSDGLRLVEEVRPDVVLCDLQLPDIPGVEVISRLRVHFPSINCLVVTTFDSDDFIFDAIKAGAKGYVLKDVSAAELADAVRAVARNESLLQPIVARKIVERLGDLAREGDLVETLTDREVEVLQALAGGARNKEIAYQLGLSESTVKTHLASIFGKLGVTTRTEAVSRGRELGIIPL